MALSPAAKAIAKKFEEAAAAQALSHNDLTRWLSDAVSDLVKQAGGYGSYSYLVDFIGDSTSGDVIYCCGGDWKMAPYEIVSVNGKMTAQIDDDNVVDVLPRTVYEPEADEADHYASMEAAKLYTKGPAPLCERLISKSARDAMAPENFAGKGKSFPIKTAKDVKAAVSSMGRAGADNYDTGTLKRNIIKIAKANGLTSALPKAWQDGGVSSESFQRDLLADVLAEVKAPEGLLDVLMPLSEAAKGKAAQSMHDKAVTGKNQKSHDASVKLGAKCPPDCAMGADDDSTTEAAVIEITGDCIELREGAVGLDGTAMLKLISPGWGSCGYYSEKVLERDGPKCFGEGTKNYWNHQTEAEEAARPEGDLRDLASVLTKAARYDKEGPAGPGLYAPANVFEQFRQPVNDLAKHIGMSIRATGKAREGVAPDGKRGKIIEQLTNGISVDYVTTPGAGGQILQLFEAARAASRPPTNREENDGMNAAEQTQFREMQADLKKMRERQATADAGGIIAHYFTTIRVAEGVQQRVTARLLGGNIPLTETSTLDEKKLKEFAQKEVEDELAYLSKISGGRLVVGMGATSPAPLSEKKQKKAIKESQREAKEMNRGFASLMGIETKAGRKILLEGRRGFDATYNARENGAMPWTAPQSQGSSLREEL